MAIVTLGIDLAKNVFALHGVGPTGKPELVRPEIRRSRRLELVAPCRRVLSGWKPARARTTGLGNSRSSVILLV